MMWNHIHGRQRARKRSRKPGGLIACDGDRRETKDFSKEVAGISDAQRFATRLRAGTTSCSSANFLRKWSCGPSSYATADSLGRNHDRLLRNRGMGAEALECGMRSTHRSLVDVTCSIFRLLSGAGEQLLLCCRQFITFQHTSVVLI